MFFMFKIYVNGKSDQFHFDLISIVFLCYFFSFLFWGGGGGGGERDRDIKRRAKIHIYPCF